MTLPEDIASDCVDIVTLLGKCEGKIINIGPIMADRIRETASRIQNFTAHDAIMKAGE